MAPSPESSGMNQKEQNMKTSIKTVIAATVVALGALGSGYAAARGGYHDGGMHGDRAGWHQMSPERIKDRVDLGLARLELALAIKPEQKGAWDQFKTSVLARADKRAAEFEARAKDAPPKTALERLERAERIGKTRVAELADVRRDVEALYGKLSDAQKKVFDAEFREGGLGGHGPHGMKGPRRGAAPEQGPRAPQGQQPAARS